MSRTSCLLLAVAAICGDLLAQSNSRGPGYNGALYTVGSATYYGRRGSGYPNGEVGVAFMNGLCNPGSIVIEWRAPMLPDHPKFGFMTAKLQNDRMIQISDWSYCKHAFLSLNDPGSCGTCQNTASANQMYIGCSDVYSAGNNASRDYLGPPEEIDPWLATWNPIGSYFDRGDPDVGPPNNTNGVRNTINVGTDNVKNRVTMKEADLVGAANGSLFFQIHVLHEGEPAINRGNNIMSRGFHLNWTGSTWQATTATAGATHGSLLTRWPGATITMGGNGNDDGRFEIAVKVTGPTNGLWHYEYAVHNVDNARGGASLHIPVCSTGRVQNLGFRDIDQNALNEWIGTFSGGEVVWTAPANNPHNWNQLLNFWFDSDVAPAAGTATIDQARIGAGALAVAVPTTVPGLQHGVWLGNGCGAPPLELRANGVPSAGNASFAIDVIGAPATGLFAFFSFGAGNVTLAPGCTQWLDATLLGTHGFLMTDGAGLASIPLGVPAGFAPMDLRWQAASLITGGPIYSTFGLSNGLLVRLAGSTCQ
jgi:hypothetical protein